MRVAIDEAGIATGQGRVRKERLTVLDIPNGKSPTLAVLDWIAKHKPGLPCATMGTPHGYHAYGIPATL